MIFEKGRHPFDDLFRNRAEKKLTTPHRNERNCVAFTMQSQNNSSFHVSQQIYKTSSSTHLDETTSVLAVPSHTHPITGLPLQNNLHN